MWQGPARWSGAGLRVTGIEGDGAALNSAFSDGDFKAVRAFHPSIWQPGQQL
jgi:hypothetical protein